MSVFRFLPKHLKRRASRFRPKSLPDHYAYAAFFDVRAKLFDGDDMMVLEYPDRATQGLLFRHAVEKFDLRDKKIIDLAAAWATSRNTWMRAFWAIGLDRIPRST